MRTGTSGNRPGATTLQRKGQDALEVHDRVAGTAAKDPPFADKQDFEEAKRGFIAAPPYRKIMNDKGGVAWDIDSWNFLLQGKDYDSIHPSLQRQATLNMEYGLFEVVPGIYQVRGFDLANISFIKGKTGWIVIDPLTVRETSRAALKFVNEKLGERPVVAVVISHSHADYFGGIRGVVDDAHSLRERCRSLRRKVSCRSRSRRTSSAGMV